MIYIISYALNKKGKDYEGVFEAIKSCAKSGCSHIMKSTWLIRSELSAHKIYERIKKHLDSDDTCIVIEVNKENRKGVYSSEDCTYLRDVIFK